MILLAQASLRVGFLFPTFHCSNIPRLPPACHRLAQGPVSTTACLAMAGRSPGTAYGSNASVHGNGGQASFHVDGMN